MSHDHDDSTQGPEEAQKRIMDHIIEHGHSVTAVFDAKPPFAYTVGRTMKDRPELLIVGPLPPKIMQHILNDAADLDDEEPLVAGTERDGILDGYPVRVVAVDLEASEMFGARQFFGDDATALQLVWPDQAGAFPGDPDYDYPAEVQPVHEVA